MAGYVVGGSQWGDEGKGKIVDLLGTHMDMVVRFQGGNNAGHTVVVNGRTVILLAADLSELRLDGDADGKGDLGDA